MGGAGATGPTSSGSSSGGSSSGGSSSGGSGGASNGGSGGASLATTMSVLDGLRVELPCGPHLSNPTWGCPTTSSSSIVVVGGDAGTTYQVTLRVRGVVEQNGYFNGAQDGYFYTAGVASNAGWNEARLDVSAPMQHFFLNAGATDIPYCFGVDYAVTIPIQGGATVRLVNDGKDGAQVINIDDQGNPISLGTIAGFTQPYDGQWLQLDVVNVTL